MITTDNSRRRVFAILAAALTLAGCSTEPTDNAPTGTQTASLDYYGLAGLDAPQIINNLDTMPVAERPDDLIASVQPTGLILTSAIRVNDLSAR